MSLHKAKLVSNTVSEILLCNCHSGLFITNVLLSVCLWLIWLHFLSVCLSVCPSVRPSVCLLSALSTFCHEHFKWPIFTVMNAIRLLADNVYRFCQRGELHGGIPATTTWQITGNIAKGQPGCEKRGCYTWCYSALGWTWSGPASATTWTTPCQLCAHAIPHRTTCRA